MSHDITNNGRLFDSVAPRNIRELTRSWASSVKQIFHGKLFIVISMFWSPLPENCDLAERNYCPDVAFSCSHVWKGPGTVEGRHRPVVVQGQRLSSRAWQLSPNHPPVGPGQSLCPHPHGQTSTYLALRSSSPCQDNGQQEFTICACL